MENQKLKAEDLRVDTLGEPIIPSPLGLNTEDGDQTANYVPDSRTVLFDVDRDTVQAMVRAGVEPPAFQLAGPREKIFFDGAVVRAAIVTCGGLCPGINNVIRTLVMELHYRYGVRSILGIRYGFRGFIPKLGYEPIPLTPDLSRTSTKKAGASSVPRADSRIRRRSLTSSRRSASRFSSRSAGTGLSERRGRYTGK